MYVRIKSTATALLVATAFLCAGGLFGQGSDTDIHAQPANQASLLVNVHTPDGIEQIPVRRSNAQARGGLQRHAAMPFFSFSRSLK